MLIVCQTIEDFMSYERYQDIFKHHIKSITDQLAKRLSGEFRDRILGVIIRLFKLYSRQINEMPELFSQVATVIKQQVDTPNTDRIADPFIMTLLNWVEECIESNRYPNYNQGFVKLVLSLFGVASIQDNPYFDRLLKITKYILY